jgi:DUF1365 family protein
MAYLDLGELDRVFRGRWLWSTSRLALARFDRRDHLGDPALPLDESVRRLVAERTGMRPAGPIRLLTHLRYFGYVFNPVSFYYCFDAQGQSVEAVVAEVNNTPWGERHCYVLHAFARSAGTLQARTRKAMHVSPFHPMALEYAWRFSVPGERLAVRMALSPAPGAIAASRPLTAPERTRDADARTASDASAVSPVFDAAMTLHRVPIEGRSLAATLLRFPAMTVQVIAAIHWQAVRLWLKRVPVHDHPSRRFSADASASTPTEHNP